jgi:hypothetical protein
MAFIFGEKQNREFKPLTEESIRNRLYGSACGIAHETAENESSKNQDSQGKPIPQPEKKENSENERMRQELALLKSELEQIKRLSAAGSAGNNKELMKKIFFAAAVSAVLLVSVFAIKNIFFKNSPPAEAPGQKTLKSSSARYTVQIAVSDNLVEAERFKAALESKGYRLFISKSSYSSGRDKFTIFAGESNDIKAAKDLMEQLKSREGIKDAFITEIPKRP